MLMMALSRHPELLHEIAAIVLALSVLGLFLSSWVIIPSINRPALRLTVIIPEFSPWLAVEQTGLLILAGFLGWQAVQPPWLWQGSMVIETIALGLALWPSLNLPTTISRFDAALQQVCHPADLAKVPVEIQNTWRSRPFSWGQFWVSSKEKPFQVHHQIPFACPDGVSLTMDVYQPPVAGCYPTIVTVYGGSWRRGHPRQGYRLSQYLAAQGYVVFAISYRHAPQYHFPAQLEDVKAALAHIRCHGQDFWANPDQMALMGRSAGGHLAMLAAYEPDAPPIEAVVAYYSPYDLVLGYQDPPKPDPVKVRSVLHQFLGGSLDQYPDLYRKASPTTYVTRPLPPTLLLQGCRDHLVEARFAYKMADLLRQSSTPTILLDIPWADHAFDILFNGISNHLTVYYVERFLAWALYGDRTAPQRKGYFAKIAE